MRSSRWSQQEASLIPPISELNYDAMTQLCFFRGVVRCVVALSSVRFPCQWPFSRIIGLSCPKANSVALRRRLTRRGQRHTPLACVAIVMKHRPRVHRAYRLWRRSTLFFRFAFEVAPNRPPAPPPLQLQTHTQGASIKHSLPKAASLLPFFSTMKVLEVLCGLFLPFVGSRGTVRLAAANADPTLENVDPISDKCWVFMHLQKCGGSTVKEILHDSWGHRFFIYDSERWKLGDDFLHTFGNKLTAGKQWNVMTGGYTEALRRSSGVDEKCRWFTLFRHPISRMVSAYYYCKELPGDVACASQVVKARDVDLTTFAKHWGNFAMRQFALSLVPADEVMEYSKTDAVREKLPAEIEEVRKIPGWYLLKMYLDDQARTSEYVEIADVAMYEMMQPVQDVLRDRYTVGILEEFDTTLSLFDAALDMPEVDWHKQYGSAGKVNVDNVYSQQKAASLVEAWTNSEIKKYMQLDLVLYEHAVDVFHEQARAYGLE